MSKLERRKALGLWLKNRREKLNITQSTLAQNLGYENAQIISNIERGVTAIPQTRVSEFAIVLKCNPTEMNLRVIASSFKEEEAIRAADLALKYFPLIQAMEASEHSTRDQLLNYAYNKLEVDRKKIE